MTAPGLSLYIRVCLEDVIWDSISSLYSQGQILDENGNSVSIVGSDGTTYVEGDSSYTVTLDSYENTVDLTEAAESASWDDDQVEQPQMLWEGAFES